MTDLSQHNFTHDQIVKILENREGIDRTQFKVMLIRNGFAYRELDTQSFLIDCDNGNSVKYSGSFYFRTNPMINWNTDRIQPFMILPYRDVLFSWPLCPPLDGKKRSESIEPGISVTAVDCYDELSYLKNNSLDETEYFEKNVGYMELLEWLLKKANYTEYNIVPTDKGIQSGREFEQGEKLLEIMNTLLEEIGYASAYPDKNGTLISKPYESIYAIDPQIHYRHIYPSITKAFDTRDRPNRFIGYVQNPEIYEPMRYEYINESKTSPLSTANLGYVVTADPRQYNNVADFDTLQSLVLKWAEEETIGYEQITFQTKVMPHHEVDELIALRSELVTGIFLETKWRVSVSLDSDGNEESYMDHTVRGLYGE